MNGTEPGPQVVPEATERERSLSDELTEFLVQLSVGIRRFAIYPPGHPSLEPAVGNIVRRLGPFFRDRRVLQIGIAKDQLVIEGLATDSKHPVLRELGRRLHDQHLGAIAFTAGVTPAEVEDFLKTLAPELEGDAVPLGLLPARDRPTWESIAIFPVGYDQLRLQEGTSDRATELWLGLAQAAMAGEAFADDELPDARALAETIQTHAPETAYDQAIVGYMLGLAEELKHGGGQEDHPVRQSVSELVAELDEPTLARLLKMGGHATQRKRFVLDASQSLAGDSVVKVLKAAATASEQTISTSLTRLLSKLAIHAEYGPGEVPSQANAALRDNVEQLISDWEQKDPNPQSYTMVLDSMSRAAPILDGQESPSERITGPERIVQMSLEVDVFGPTVEKAVDELIDQGEIKYIMELIKEVPEGGKVPEQLRDQVMRPSTLWRLVESGHVGEDSLGLVVEGMRGAAAGPLLDVLLDSDSRSLRRKIFDYLLRLGPLAGMAAIQRLDDPRWYVTRNILSLLNRTRVLPGGFDPVPYIGHEDLRVRREALSLSLSHKSVRPRAVVAGLAEEDGRMLRTTLLAIQDELPDPAFPVVIDAILNADWDPELRALAVRSLRHTRSRSVPETLISMVVSRTTIFGRLKIAHAAPDVLAALEVLRDAWPDYPQVAAILKAARRSKDPATRAAAGEGEASGA